MQTLFFTLCLVQLLVSQAHAEQRPQLEKYFFDTYASLECMRNPSGLIYDHYWFSTQPVLQAKEQNKSLCPEIRAKNNATSPTNIAFDILSQLEAQKFEVIAQSASEKLLKTLQRLSQLERHRETGLFFARYHVAEPCAVEHYFISSVDNVHLYLALHVLLRAEQTLFAHIVNEGAGGGQARAPLNHAEARHNLSQAAQIAKQLLTTFQIAAFFDPLTGLAHGGLELVDGHWQKTAWAFRHYGSEGRILYILGHALGINTFSPTLAKNLIFEFYTPTTGEGDMLSLWDGGAFQLLLPRLLLREDLYSEKYKKYYANYARYALNEKQRRQIRTPANHSAVQYSTKEDIYLGSAGSLALVSQMNRDLDDPIKRARWQSVFTPHAAFLAAPILVDEYLTQLLDLEGLSDESNQLYVPGLGWADGYHVEGERHGEIVNAMLALDQSMILFSVAEMLSTTKMTLSAEVIYNDDKLRAANANYFKLIELFHR